MSALAIRTPPEPFPPLRVNRYGWHTMGELSETASISTISTIFTTLRPLESGEDGSGVGMMPHPPQAIEMTDAAASPHRVSTYAFSGCLAPWFFRTPKTDSRTPLFPLPSARCRRPTAPPATHAVHPRVMWSANLCLCLQTERWFGMIVNRVGYSWTAVPSTSLCSGGGTDVDGSRESTGCTH